MVVGVDTPLEAVEQALRRVLDPCSVAAGRPTDIVSMGLVQKLDLRPGGQLVVDIVVTSPGCTLVANISRAIEESLLAVEGISMVDIEVDASHVWTPPEGFSAPTSAWVGTKPQSWRQETQQHQNSEVSRT